MCSSRSAEFAAPDFDALFEGVRSVPWRDLLAKFPAVNVEARSSASRLTAVPTLQSVTKKAIVDALRGSAARMPETGPRYEVQLSLQKDQATLCLDTTGPGLHKRGYRRHTGEAPLRENLAAALVLLSRWDPSRPFADPVCGSGTIAIEAALLAANIAPGDFPSLCRGRLAPSACVRLDGGAGIGTRGAHPHAGSGHRGLRSQTRKW